MISRGADEQRHESHRIRYGVAVCRHLGGPRVSFRRTYYDRWPRPGRRERPRTRADPGPSERSTSEMRPRLHSFGGAGAFHRAPSELERSRQSTRALLGVKMCPLRRALTMWSQPPRAPGSPDASAATAAAACCQLARMERRPPEYGVRVEPSSVRPPGLRVLDDPQYQNLTELRKQPEYANLEEISREFGYRLCPEGQNLEDEAIYENILSVRQIRSAEVRLVPVSEVAYYEGQGYVATQVLSRNGTFPQCAHAWGRLHAQARPTGSLRLFTVNVPGLSRLVLIDS